MNRKGDGNSTFTCTCLQETSINQVNGRNPPVYVEVITTCVWLHKEFDIVTSSYGGLWHFFRVRGGPVDPVIETIQECLGSTRGQPVSSSQVLTGWLRRQGILVVM
ncbi:hypothetical protein K503DRAFT_807136 [Rhizopogon vinicolor AM-OR11-026]|uniref:Uncharacterized protein n=1 Tax=Rhizopogon vinicolor AM-OR11-026 TaxID=1314800 RepID=A0A1B7MD59_9AGAM|nr:hypothetical protein K503DRAFT_807136 [Rhizopogon vinicolor AM-OR11-026]